MRMRGYVTRTSLVGGGKLPPQVAEGATAPLAAGRDSRHSRSSDGSGPTSAGPWASVGTPPSPPHSAQTSKPS